MRGAAVSVGDHLGNRKTQARTRASAGLIRTSEAFERLGNELGRNPPPLVEDVQLDPAVRFHPAETDRSVTVAERILDEVAESLFEANGIRRHDEPVRGLDLDRAAGCLRTPSEARRDS